MGFTRLGDVPTWNDAVVELMKTEQREHSVLRLNGLPRLEDRDMTIEQRVADVQRWLAMVEDGEDYHAWLLAAMHCISAATAALRVAEASHSSSDLVDCPDCRPELPYCGTCSGAKVVRA